MMSVGAFGFPVAERQGYIVAASDTHGVAHRPKLIQGDAKLAQRYAQFRSRLHSSLLKPLHMFSSRWTKFFRQLLGRRHTASRRQRRTFHNECQLETLEDRSLCTATSAVIPTTLAPLADTAVTVNATAYRPQTPNFNWQNHAVPEATEDTTGVGVRMNGDDDNHNGRPDRDDTSVSGENDLVRVRLEGTGATQYFVTRDNANIRVWDSVTKGTAILVSQDSASLTINGSRDVWVEYAGTVAGSSLLTFDGRDSAGQVLSSDRLNIYSFTSVVLVLGGYTQVPGDPVNSNLGTFQSAIDLYDQGYDVHTYNQNQFRGLKTDAPYVDAVQSVQKLGETKIGIFGYSWGGGGTYGLSKLLNANRTSIGSFAIQFTAYVDGITSSSISSERRLPPGSLYHFNLFQRHDVGLFQLAGNSVTGAGENYNVTSQSWGRDLTHYTIDDNVLVRDLVKTRLIAKLSR